MSKTGNGTLRIHSKIPCSLANGPGRRAVVWLQGCSLKCRGCFNPNLWDPSGGIETDIGALLSWLTSIRGISGLTISGGEPTEQIFSLLPFLKNIRSRTDLSILLFSGKTLEEILKIPEGEKLISLLDVLIDGRYEPEKANPPGHWPASSNQRIHLLTNRYTIRDFLSIPHGEILISEKGDIIESGMIGGVK